MEGTFMPLMTTKPMFDLAYDGGFAIGAFNVKIPNQTTQYEPHFHVGEAKESNSLADKKDEDQLYIVVQHLLLSNAPSRPK